MDCISELSTITVYQNTGFIDAEMYFIIPVNLIEHLNADGGPVVQPNDCHTAISKQINHRICYLSSLICTQLFLYIVEG